MKRHVPSLHTFSLSSILNKREMIGTECQQGRMAGRGLLVSIIHGKYVCTAWMQGMGALLILSRCSWSGITSTLKEPDLVEGVPACSSEFGTGWSSNPNHSVIYHWQPLWWLRDCSSFMDQQWNHTGYQIFSSVAPWFWGMFPGGSLCFWNDGLGASIRHDMACLPELGSKAQHSLQSSMPTVQFCWCLLPA